MKNNIFHSLLAACCLALPLAALNAQQANVLAVAASAGGTGTLGGIEITWTLGEVAVSGPPFVLDAAHQFTTGFHQPPAACAPAATALAQKICPGSSVQFGSQVLSAAGVYTDTLVAANGCDSIVTLTLGLNLPPTAQATASDTLTCSKGQITLSSSGSSSGAGFLYQWTTANGNILSGATTPTPTVDEGGDYQLVVKNVTSGCADTALVKAVETGEAILGVSLTTSDPSCAGLTDGAISVSVGQGASSLLYGLDGGALQANPSFEGLAAGTFNVRVKNDSCEVAQSVVLKAPAPLTVALAAPPGLLAAGASVTLVPTIAGAQGALTFAWAGSSLSCTDCAAPEISPDFTRLYAVTVTDSKGCSATASVTVSVDGSLGPDIITPGDENGKNDELVFPELEKEPARSANDIVIFSRWGQVVFKAAPYLNNWNGVNQGGKELPEGTYYYILTLRDAAKDVIRGSVLLIR